MLRFCFLSKHLLPECIDGISGSDAAYERRTLFEDPSGYITLYPLIDNHLKMTHIHQLSPELLPVERRAQAT